MLCDYFSSNFYSNIAQQLSKGFGGLLLILLIFFSACTSDGQKQGNAQKETASKNKQAQKTMELPFQLDNNGLYIENLPKAATDENRYTADNQIYQSEREMVFSYYFIKKGDTSRMRIFSDDEKHSKNVAFPDDWELVPYKNKEKGLKVITHAGMKVLTGMGAMADIENFNQSAMQMNYFNAFGKQISMEQTGFIENERNIWLHPFRSRLFRILELNPFPYLKFPLKVGTKGRWKSLEISSHWGNKRWKEWQGNITNKYLYQIIGEEKLSTSIGLLDCFVVRAQADSELGRTALVGHFNEKYGFVKMDYLNIDSSRIVLNIDRTNF